MENNYQMIDKIQLGDGTLIILKLNYFEKGNKYNTVKNIGFYQVCKVLYNIRIATVTM